MHVEIGFIFLLMPDHAPFAYLTLIRHAESRANVERVLQGVTDAPLSARGEEQLKALEAAWRPTDDASNAFGLPEPHLVVASPIGRAYKTGQAVARGCRLQDADDENISFRSPPAEVPAAKRHTTLLLDPGLSERNFGSAECTRKGQYVPGYNKPPSGELGRADTHASFQKKVTKAANKWIQWLVEVAEQCRQPEAAEEAQPDEPTADASREATPEPGVSLMSASHTQTDVAGRDNKSFPSSRKRSAQGSTPDASALPSEAKPPHLVLVTHGQWIHTFLSRAIQEFRNTFYVRSSNTGLFTLALYQNPTGIPSLRVIHHDDTRHLGLDSRSMKKRTQSTTLDALWPQPEK